MSFSINWLNKFFPALRMSLRPDSTTLDKPSYQISQPHYPLTYSLRSPPRAIGGRECHPLKLCCRISGSSTTSGLSDFGALGVTVCTGSTSRLNKKDHVRASPAPSDIVFFPAFAQQFTFQSSRGQDGLLAGSVPEACPGAQQKKRKQSNMIIKERINKSRALENKLQPRRHSNQQ